MSLTGASSTERQWEQNASKRTGAGRVYDPYPRFASLRRERPIHPHSFFELFEVEDPLSHVWGDTPRFATLGHSITEEVLRDNSTFSNAGKRKMTEKQFGRVSLMASDPPEHTRYRALVQPAFSRRGLPMWERWIKPRLDDLIDGFIETGQVDLYSEYCAKFPAHVIAMALGVDANDVSEFHRWASLLQIGAALPAEAEAANHLVTEYMTKIIEARRQEPQEDLITLLVESTIDEGDGPRSLSDEQILGLVRNILPAGVGTTYRTLGITLLTLLNRPELLARLYGDRDLVPLVFDEVLRWNGPITFAARTAARDTEIAGLKIPSGSLIEVGIGPANRDPQQFADPDRFDPFRTLQPHLAFSTGPHFCVGMQVARLELYAGLNRLLDRLPRLRLDPQAPAPEVTGLWYRMPTGVPVLFG